MMESLLKVLEYFISVVAQLTVLFLGISVVVELILMYIPQEKINGWLSRRGIVGNFLGAVLGALTPFWVCSTMPMAFGLLNGGAPFGPILSFIVSSPLLNPIIVGLIAAFLGVKAAVVYFAITFSSAVIFGFIVGDSGKKYFKNQKINSCESEEDDEEIPQNFTDKLKSAWQTSWENFRAITPYLLAGIGVGAFIYGLVPQETIIEYAGAQNPFAIPIAAVIGIPLYIRAESAIPIGIALMSKGMSVGAVMAFIIGGAGMAIPEMSLLLGFFKLKLVVMIVAIIYFTAVIGGYVFNWI